MEKMTGIAQDYLESFEILRDARMELEGELQKWWKVLVNDVLLPAFRDNSIFDRYWENKSNPGLLDIVAKSGLTLRVCDPRQSGARNYLIFVFWTVPLITKLRKNAVVVKMLEGMKTELGCEEFFERDDRVASLTVDIDGNEPEKTMKAVLGASQKLFEVIAKLSMI